ncbi:MAG TPA: hypothetical protein PKM65_14540 [Spirochaetota bacterium]|nr:hypothetical protein [Spirochaetota bacterium]HNT10546.1 hypothetical protein [Spirochaetota bacterium]HNV47559.1 hypothetical protein [Spirochaetota bacterium]HPU88881.1 hypothetical protein [Spirochaetota bacterium]
MYMKLMTIMALIAAVSAAPLYARDYVTKTNAGSVNWTRGTIVTAAASRLSMSDDGQIMDAHGIQSIPLNRARMESYAHARERSIENAVNILRGVRIDPETTFGDLLKNDRITQQRLSDVLERAARTKKQPSGFFATSCETTIRLRDIVPALNYEFPAVAFPERDDAQLATRYTGVIIDGRGIDIQPMLFPSIYTEDGLELYGRHHIDIRYASRRGLAAYCYNENDAVKNRRAGDRPFYTTALTSIRNCPVIAESDARKILGSPATRENLKKCRVIIILSAKKR